VVADLDPRMPLSWRIHQQGKSIHGMLKGLGALLAIRGDLPVAPASIGSFRAAPTPVRVPWEARKEHGNEA